MSADETVLRSTYDVAHATSFAYAGQCGRLAASLISAVRDMEACARWLRTGHRPEAIAADLERWAEEARKALDETGLSSVLGGTDARTMSEAAGDEVSP